MVVLGVMLWLVGCSSRGPVVRQFTDWRVQGRAVLELDGQRKGVRFHAWRTGSAHVMEIQLPLGQGRWRLGQDKVPWLEDAQGHRLEGAQEVQAWLDAQLGVSLPPALWFDLLRNRPPAKLRHSGWSLAVSAEPWRPHCPEKLLLKGARGQVTLLLRQWQGSCD